MSSYNFKIPIELLPPNEPKDHSLPLTVYCTLCNKQVKAARITKKHCESCMRKKKLARDKVYYLLHTKIPTHSSDLGSFPVYPSDLIGLAQESELGHLDTPIPLE